MFQSIRKQLRRPLLLIVLVTAAHPLTTYADLNLLPGMTPAEASAAAGTQAVYEKLFSLSQTTTLTPEQNALFIITRDLVETSNELQGTAPNGNTLYLDVAGLKKALQWVAAEELTTPGTMATQTSSGQLTSLAGRFSALRHGVTGFQASLDNGQAYGYSHAPLVLAMTSDGDMSGVASPNNDASGFSKLSGFLNASYGIGNKDPTTREDAFDYNNGNVTTGLDYRLTNNFIYGLALGYTAYKSTFDSTKSVSDGSVKSGAYNGTLYGMYMLGAMSFDASAGYGTNNFDIVRHIRYPSNNANIPPTNEVAYGSTSGKQSTLSIGANFDGHQQGTNYSYQGHLNYIKATIQGYTETNAHAYNLQIEDQDVTSLVSNIGGQVTHSFSQNYGVVIPEATLIWHHQFKNDSRVVLARYVADPLANNYLAAPTDKPDRDYFTLGLGTSAVFRGGTQAFIHYETLLGLQNIHDQLITAGVRLEF